MKNRTNTRKTTSPQARPAAHSRPEPTHDLGTGEDGLTDALDVSGLSLLLTVDEVADLLRTSRRAVYAMIERGRLPAVIRIGRRVLLHRDDLLHWLDQKRAPSPKENRR